MFNKSFHKNNSFINHEIILNNGLVPYRNYSVLKRVLRKYSNSFFCSEYLTEATEANVNDADIKWMKSNVYDENSDSCTLVDHQLYEMKYSIIWE